MFDYSGALPPIVSALKSVTVRIDGKDVSTKMLPFVQDCEIADFAGTSSDTARLTFNDMNGQIGLPPMGRPIEIGIDGALMFGGTVDEVRSTAARGSGRLLQVSAKGFDSRGKAKQRQMFHMDDTTLGEFFEKAARNAGMSKVVIDPAFASIFRDYWSMDKTSFLAAGQKLANELGGTFKIRGDVAVLAKRGTGMNPSGQEMPTILCRNPGNLISWDIEPSIGRARFTKARVRYFDRKSATYKEGAIEIEPRDDGPEVEQIALHDAADADQAQAMADGMRSDADRETGGGSVILDFTPQAQAEGKAVLLGTRPGIDGEYRIESVRHTLSRAGGSTTSLDLREPMGTAGKDTRGSGAT